MQIEMTQDLRDLLRLQRKVVVRTTQRGAALAAGQMSEVWWQQIESGRQPTVLADTLATMFYAVNTDPKQLRKIGQDKVADLMERREALLEPEPERPVAATAMEDHLLETPGLSEGQKIVLIEVAKGLVRAEQDEQVTIAK